MSALASQTMSEADYLLFERKNEAKHEFFAGEVFAMTGASEAHNLISTSTSFLLYGQLRGRSCKIYPGDMRVKVTATGLYTYPDISVVCGETEFTDDQLDTLINPTVIIEILSPSTERYDRGKKFQHYREIASLQEYILIAQDSPRIERYRRQTGNAWEFMDASSLDAELELPSIGCVLALAEVYEQVDFSADDDESPNE